MDKLVYVETSVPRFCFDTRSGHEMQAMRHWPLEKTVPRGEPGTPGHAAGKISKSTRTRLFLGAWCFP